MDYSVCYKYFENLSAKEKALFIDARLAWATNGGLTGEITLRLCHPGEDEGQGPRD